MKLTVGLMSETCSSVLLLETFGLGSGGPRSGALARFMSRLHGRLLALPCSPVNGVRPRLPRMTLCSHFAPHSGALVFVCVCGSFPGGQCASNSWTGTVAGTLLLLSCMN